MFSDKRFWPAVIISIGVVICFPLAGCEQTLTKSEWDTRYAPADVNEALAKVALEKGLAETKQKLKSMALMDKAKVSFVIGAVASIAAILLGTPGLKGFGFGALASCIAGIALIQFYQTWPVWFAYAGGGIALGAGSISIWRYREALCEVVGNVEQVKKMGGSIYNTDVVEQALKNQSPATKSLVAGIRKKIK